MTPKKIKTHLSIYSIYKKRRSTIINAFASALAPSDSFDEKIIETALIELGQKDLKKLACVYCGAFAQTWDHLKNLVKDDELDGYGHQIGNLVPCCKDCNSRKGGKSFHEYVKTLDISNTEKENLNFRLEKHLSLAKEIKANNTPEFMDAKKNYDAIRSQILNLMQDADKAAQVIRDLRSRG